MKYPVIVALALMAAACSRPPQEWRRAEGAVWHTTYSVTYQSDRDLTDSIIGAMTRVEESLSPFRADSRISLINRGESMATDSLVRRVFHHSQTVNELSEGMFDPTVAPLINYWGFGYAEADTVTPLDSIRSRVGIDRCSIGPDGLMRKLHPLTEFNFSAITKGLGCDEVAAALRRCGVSNYLVEIGGEITAGGTSPRGAEWTVAIDAPVQSNTEVIHSEMMTLTLTDCGVATSGNYRNYRLTAQGRTSHTINPRTGRPVTLDEAGRDTIILSATVVAPTAMEADALATASMLLEPAHSAAMIRAAGASQLILAVSTPTDSLLILTTAL